MSRLAIYACILFLGTLQNLCQGGQGVGLSALMGGRFSYSVMPGDSLEKIGARFGVSAAVLARDNGILDPDLIMQGRNLQVDNHHIVPEPLQNGIVINIPQRMLFFFQDRKLLAFYPVGVGKPSWPTVQGSFHVAGVKANPVWLVPKSIQEEMAREGQIVENKVPPGPDNPLGKFWIGLDAPGYGIHSTIAPASVYHFQSHGCIRLHPDDMVLLFPRVNKGLIVELVYFPVLMAEETGRVFVEINPDVYTREQPPLDLVRQLAAVNHVADRIDWRRVQELVLRQDGVARDVTLGETDESNK
jgi:L,D-transpeptidase ErfK/SrfK